MIFVLADTSVWLDHLRSRNPLMDQLGAQERLLMHPYVIGELSMGNLPDRPQFLNGLQLMDRVIKADDSEVFAMIEANRLFGSGIGWMDAHLLASTLLTDDLRLWTRDRRLNAAAERLGCAAQLHH